MHSTLLSSLYLLCLAATPASATETPTTLPGAEAFPFSLQEKLASALGQRGKDYVPRTRHRRPDGSPQYSNRLLLEASPYLQQHAHNPVNWYPWGDEAFEVARKKGRPVMVSIGYSTCHWCHVMEEESFDDPAVARILNEHFVAIKVDREARPDVDAVYMSAVHAMGQRGGWPLNVWVTPNRVPFYGGTYFPPRDQPGERGRPGFSRLLTTIHEQYAQDPKRFENHAKRLVSEMTLRLSGNQEATSFPLELSLLKTTFEHYDRVADDEWGGVKQRIKFPSSLPTSLLLRWHARSGDDRALAIATRSLDAMAQGGIHDQLGGGFHRYSTDTRWLVPHFEKMLYNQALLAVAYNEAWQETGQQRFAGVTRDILDYVLRELTAPGGGFYSATDADSSDPQGEMEEGRFFTWTPAEIDAILGPAQGEILRAWYGVTETGDLDGRSVLRTWRDPSEFIASYGVSAEVLEKTIAEASRKLRDARDLRLAPLRDDKVIVGWTGLTISALARAGFALNEERYLAAARRAADFLLTHMRKDGRLMRIWLNEQAAGPAFLSDYAFLIAGLIDLYEASPDTRWLEEATALQRVLDSHFADPTGGYFRTAKDHPILLVREKPQTDGAIPSGNSVASLNLLRLATLAGDENLRASALQYLSSQAQSLREHPGNASELLLALDYALDTPKEILIVKSQREEGGGLLDVLRKSYVPNRVISIVAEGVERDSHAKLIPLLKYKVAQKGRTTAYVCENQVCKLPTSDPKIFASQLQGQIPTPLAAE